MNTFIRDMDPDPDPAPELNNAFKITSRIRNTDIYIIIFQISQIAFPTVGVVFGITRIVFKYGWILNCSEEKGYLGGRGGGRATGAVRNVTLCSSVMSKCQNSDPGSWINRSATLYHILFIQEEWTELTRSWPSGPARPNPAAGPWPSCTTCSIQLGNFFHRLYGTY